MVWKLMIAVDNGKVKIYLRDGVPLLKYIITASSIYQTLPGFITILSIVLIHQFKSQLISLLIALGALVFLKMLI